MAFATEARNSSMYNNKGRNSTNDRNAYNNDMNLSEKLGSLDLGGGNTVQSRSVQNKHKELRDQQQYLLQQLLAQQTQSQPSQQQRYSAQDASRSHQQGYFQQQELERAHQLEQIRLHRQLEMQKLQQQQLLQAQLYASQFVQTQPGAVITSNPPFPADPRLQAQLLANLQIQQEQLRQQQLLQSLIAQRQAQQQQQVQSSQQTKRDGGEIRRQARLAQGILSNRQPSQAATTLPSAQTPRTVKTPPQSPNVDPTSSPIDKPTHPAKPLGRFAQARQSAGTPFGELTSLLARRSAETSTPSINANNTSETIKEVADKQAARQALITLGHSRAPTSNTSRSVSNPFPSTTTTSTNSATRIVSAPVTNVKAVKPVRMPLGPPAPVDELGDRNFQSMVRKQVGKGLDVLGRREGSPIVA